MIEVGFAVPVPAVDGIAGAGAGDVAPEAAVEAPGPAGEVLETADWLAGAEAAGSGAGGRRWSSTRACRDWRAQSYRNASSGADAFPARLPILHGVSSARASESEESIGRKKHLLAWSAGEAALAAQGIMEVGKLC